MGQLSRKELLFLAGVAVALGGCAEDRYLFRPVQQATARVSGLPAARYEVPSEKPHGEVLVVSTGVTEIKPENVPQRALYARVIVSNNSDDTPWRVDTRQQAAIVGDRRIAPTYVNTFGQPLPVVEIPRGEKRTIDFYFPAPPGADSNSEVPAFDLSWSVETGTRTVAERTTFDRYRVEPVYTGGYYGYWGYPYYPYRWGWYDPFWGPHYSVYYGYGWGYPAYHYRGGWYGAPAYGGGGARPSYTRPAVRPR